MGDVYCSLYLLSIRQGRLLFYTTSGRWLARGWLIEEAVAPHVAVVATPRRFISPRSTSAVFECGATIIGSLQY